MEDLWKLVATAANLMTFVCFQFQSCSHLTVRRARSVLGMQMLLISAYPLKLGFFIWMVAYPAGNFLSNYVSNCTLSLSLSLFFFCFHVFGFRIFLLGSSLPPGGPLLLLMVLPHHT
jgi:hypothetical protein